MTSITARLFTAIVPLQEAWMQHEMRHVRGLPFDAVPGLDWSTAIEVEDTRRDYGEKRIRAWLFGSDGKPYSVAFMMRGKTMARSGQVSFVSAVRQTLAGGYSR